uniref:Uncharacterized protein n=1 Tax=Panagrolaimus superbus TaxID=310955 RepID=A0A914Z347_9BILA
MPKKASKKSEPSDMEIDKNIGEEEEEGSGEEVEDDDASDEEEEEDELMNDNTEAMEKLTFDFEAFPLDTGDVDGLVNLLTQIFLRTNVDCEAVAKALVEMSPLGCVYRPAEEVEDEDSENAVYGVLSMLELGGIAPFQTEIANLFLNRARKVATPDIVKKFEAIFNNKDNKQKNYLLVNERMLHFPDQIAAPAFKSLKLVHIYLSFLWLKYIYF